MLLSNFDLQARIIDNRMQKKALQVEGFGDCRCCNAANTQGRLPKDWMKAEAV